MVSGSQEASPSQNHLATFDGLRGIAAISILWLHFSTRKYGPGAPINATLSVDFFFMLSGYVLHQAYADRIKNGLSVTTFIKLRIFRLWPIACVGTAIGFLPVILAGKVEIWRAILNGSINLLVLPTIFNKGGGSFPNNPPIWSLFSEFVINIVFAISIHKLNLKVLCAIIVSSALIFTTCIYKLHDIPQFGRGIYELSGVAFRTAGPFFLGCLLEVINRPYVRTWQGNPSFFPLALALMILLLSPAFNMILINVIVIYVFFPFVICIAGRDAGSNHLVSALGKISYPLYVIHYPILILLKLAGILNYASLVGILILAYSAEIYVDVPLRRSLSKWSKLRSGKALRS